jgi:excisionase family DNA binding protein
VDKSEKIEQRNSARLLTVAEVAEILRIHPSSAYKLVQGGTLPGFKVSARWRISVQTLASWLSERTQRSRE